MAPSILNSGSRGERGGPWLAFPFGMRCGDGLMEATRLCGFERCIGFQRLFALEEGLDPRELTRDDGFGVLGDCGFVAVEGAIGLPTGASRALESALYFDTASLQEANSGGRREVAGEGESQREVSRIISVDVGLEELFEEVFTSLGDLIDLATTRATT